MRSLLRRALGTVERGTCYALALGFAITIHGFAYLTRILEEDKL